MNSEDKKPFLDAMMAMGELYNRELSTTLVSMYYEDLREFSLLSLLEAMRSHRLDPEEGKFFPKPSDLIAKLRASSLELALMAWGEVMQLSANYRKAKSDNTVTEIVVAQMGGWRKFGMSETAHFTWMKKEFTERYLMLSKRPDLINESMAKLTANKPLLFPTNE